LGSALGNPIPETPFDISKSLDPISSFSSATISSGSIQVDVTNTIGLDLSAASIVLWDVGMSQEIGSHTFPGGINDGSIESANIPLAGMTVSNTLEARISGTTLDGDTLTSTTGAISTETSFPDGLTVISATAEIPALSRDFTQRVEISEAGDNALDSATLSSGTLLLSIGNETNLEADIDILLPDLKDNGVRLRVQRTVPANTPNVDTTIDLAGYVLEPGGVITPQDVSIIIVATVDGTAPTQIAVDSADQFSVKASLSNLKFSSVTGDFDAIEADIPSSQHEIDVPEGFENIELVTTALTIEIENAAQLPGSVDILLEGDQGRTLNLVFDVTAGTADSAVTTVIDTVVSDFLSPIPSIVDISGTAIFGDGSTGTITPNDYISATISIEAPLEMIINETTIENDIESESIDQDDIDAVTEHVIEARFVYNIINHLPLGAAVNIYLGGDSATVLSNPQLLIDNIVVPAAPTTGAIVNDTISTGYQQILLDSLDIQILENDPLYIGSEIVLEGSGGESVRLTSNDYITVVARIEVEYKFDDDF
ncbi:MAG: hypothetical protein DRP45_09450, partial [Candidatus Zixiibacteriota bacterium]